MKNNLREKLEHVTPLPSWVFSVYNVLFVAICIAGVAFGALSFALALVWVFEIDFRFIRFMHLSEVMDIIMSLPYIWGILFVIAMVLAYQGTKRIQSAYRIEYYKIVIASIVSSIVLGSVLYVFGPARKIHSVFRDHMPPMFLEEDIKRHIWQKMEQGRTAGEIESVQDSGFVLMTPKKDRVQILLTPKTFISPNTNIVPYEKVKVLGMPIEKGMIRADKVFSWEKMPWDKK